MSKRYHISKDTGLPNICRANTPNSCRAQSAFGEKDIPHFEDKNDAQKYIEKQLSKKHNVFSSNRKKLDKHKQNLNENWNSINQALANLKELEEQQTYQYEGVVEDINTFFADELPEFKNVRETIQVDYTNEHLLEKDGNYYLFRTYGGDFIKYKILSVRIVEEKTTPQIEASLNLVEEINDKDIVLAVKELSGSYNTVGIHFEPEDNDTTVYFNGDKVVLERDDGSMIHGFPIYSEGDSSMMDKPYAVSVNIEMYESEERQNARVMDTGYAVYDTRSNKGAIFTYRDSSEDGGGDYYFMLDNGKLIKSPSDPGYQRIYSLSGTGNTIQATYLDELDFKE